MLLQAAADSPADNWLDRNAASEASTELLSFLSSSRRRAPPACAPRPAWCHALRCGVRSVRLQDRNGACLPFSRLLVHLEDAGSCPTPSRRRETSGQSSLSDRRASVQRFPSSIALTVQQRRSSLGSSLAERLPASVGGVLSSPRL